MAQHRVGLRQLRGPAAHLVDVLARCRRNIGKLGILMRQELVQRRVQQPDRDGQPVHDAEQVRKILALERQQLVQCGFAARQVVGHDHLPHDADALGREEHVLGPA